MLMTAEHDQSFKRDTVNGCNDNPYWLSGLDFYSKVLLFTMWAEQAVVGFSQDFQGQILGPVLPLPRHLSRIFFSQQDWQKKTIEYQ